MKMRTTILFDSCGTILSQINYTLKRITLPISYELQEDWGIQELLHESTFERLRNIFNLFQYAL